MKHKGLIKYVLYSLLTIVIALSLTGCATTGLEAGPKFVKPDPIPEGKSVVYFYRPFFLLGASDIPSIHHNGEKVLWGLPSRTYWKYSIEPGTHTFQTKAPLVRTKEVAIENEKPGQTYYLKVEYSFGIPYGLALVLKNELTAQVEMRDCFLVKEK